ncbi:hypothetical protein [Terriglobus saanensis]|uniref:DUF4199 domain-containing protein n=1 Tax=Terriglobus saanensis (strain ATCC BAA-1853 / DSM 23119 / SP1PR4) TaxID=401053 RepID=E8V0Q4_TERSS|nr:hypothetical protein [Terriglobus saanensis]ADV81117.1 hypothetical protein AciPR4_0279 [Terriglobus saanensis SP1PR4]
MAQLRVAEGAAQSGPANEESVVAEAKASGKDLGVDWSFALRCAVAVAVVAGGLQAATTKFPVLNGAETLWVLAAPAVAVTIYRRGRSGTAMRAGLGARVGAMTGILVSAAVVFAIAASGFLLRYKFHSLAADSELTAVLEQAIDHARAQGTVTPPMEALWKQPEFRAWFLILETGMMSLLTVGFSAAAGALAGSALTRKPK